MKTSYCILSQDGVNNNISKAKFREILKEDQERAKRNEARLYFHYEDEGFHILMPCNEQNKAVYRVNKRNKDAAAKRHERNTRCLNVDGTICTCTCTGCDKNGKRESRAPLSLDDFVGDKYEPIDSNDLSKIVEDKLLLEALIASLSKEEFVLIDTLYYQGGTLLNYAKELSEQTDTTVEMMRSRLRRLNNSIIKKLKKILQDWH